MEQPVSEHIAHLCACLAAGGALGIYYDLLRAIRRHYGGKLLEVLLDVVFCLPAALLVFALAMGRGGGGVRLYMFAFVLIGAALYAVSFGTIVRSAAEIVLKGADVAAKPAKKIRKSFKKIFHSWSSWVKMRVTKHRYKGREQGSGEIALEVMPFEEKKGRFLY